MIGTMKSNAGSNCQVFLARTARVMCAAFVAACSDAKPEAAPPAATRAPTIQTQLAYADPCRLVTAAEVAKVAGRPTRGVPVRVSSAESVTPSSSGSGCMYELQPEAGQEPGMLAIEMKVDGTAEMEQGLGAGVGGMFGSAKAVNDSIWDWASGLPAGLFAARRGHVGILIAMNAASLSPLGVEPLAAMALSRISDLPFAEDSADPAKAGQGKDPCALITRAEAEQQLGPLVAEPFRSRQSSPLAYGAGKSCTYYTSGHRALVVTPTYSEGKLQFGLLSGAASMVNRISGGNDGELTTTGSWDGRGNGIGGTLYFLKGDKMLEVKYRTSSTDEKGANRLANAAFPRL